MGNAMKAATRSAKNFNVENRANKVIGKEKPIVAPRHESFVDPSISKEEENKIFQKSPELVKNMEKFGIQSKVVKDTILPPGKEYGKFSDRPLPQKIEISDPRPPPIPEFGFIVPDVIPKGKITMKSAIELMKLYQTKQATIPELAVKYEMPEETLFLNLSRAVRYFSAVPKFPSEISVLIDKYKAQTLQEVSNLTKDISNEQSTEVKKFLQDRFNQLRPLSELIEKIRDEEDLLTGHQDLLKSLNADDADMKTLVQDDIEAMENKIDFLTESLVDSILPKSVTPDSPSVDMEIIAGAGGLEAGLFAHDILDMYSSLCDRRGWAMIMENQSPMQNLKGASRGDKQGENTAALSHCSFQIDASGCEDEAALCSLMLLEAGVHRVQRVPVTSKQNKIHTSTVAVTVLPSRDYVDVKINAKDLKWDTFKASGPGGQHVNKTDSAVRLTHLPTNTIVSCQRERSLIINKQVAYGMLEERLMQRKVKEASDSERGVRKTQIGTLERSEKIRTYNYPQDRITDHRLGSSVTGISRFIKQGSLFNLLQDLQGKQRLDRLKAYLEESLD